MAKKFMDVYTDLGIYILQLDDDLEFTDEAVNDLTQSLNIPGIIWHGWTPYDYDNVKYVDPAIIVFGAEVEIKSIKLYEKATEEAPQTDGNDDPIEGIRDEIIHTTAMGNRCSIEVVVNWYAGGFDVVPYKINGESAATALKPETLVQIINAYYSDHGIPPTEYRVIAPEVPIDRDDAVVLAQRGKLTGVRVAATTKPNRATAWPGYRDDSEE